MATDFDIRSKGRQTTRPIGSVTRATGQTPPKRPPLTAASHGGLITSSASTRGRRASLWHGGWLAWLDMAITAAVAVVLVLFNETMLVPGACIAIYAIYIGVRRVGGRLPFALALLAILGVVVHFTFIPDPELINTYAMYAFFFLVIGTIALVLEVPQKV